MPCYRLRRNRVCHGTPAPSATGFRRQDFRDIYLLSLILLNNYKIKHKRRSGAIIALPYPDSPGVPRGFRCPPDNGAGRPNRFQISLFQHTSRAHSPPAAGQRRPERFCLLFFSRLFFKRINERRHKSGRFLREGMNPANPACPGKSGIRKKIRTSGSLPLTSPGQAYRME